MSIQTHLLEMSAKDQNSFVLTKIFEVLGISKEKFNNLDSWDLTGSTSIWVLIGKSLRDELEDFLDNLNLDEYQRNILERIVTELAPHI